MREAPALAAPSRRPRADEGRKTKPQPARKGAASPSLMRRVFARPGMTVAGAAFAAVMTGIVANAVFFQKGRHPSPLFPQTARVDPIPGHGGPAASEPVATPKPAVSPDPPAALVPMVDHRPAPVAADKPKPPAAAVKASASKARAAKAATDKAASSNGHARANADPIKSMLAGDKTAPAPRPALAAKPRHEIAGAAPVLHN